ncbi:MAG: histidine phosphatase family protein [Alphaproteobacteria bacterium]|nr:histidine phosphatase family protein [Alphaproteobacteria bacterium]
MSALPGTTGRRRIYLMRHGHVDYFSPDVLRTGKTEDVPLTPLGREQAAASGAALAHVRFDVALSSGYPRTRQTAEIVLAANRESDHLRLGAEPGLVEIKGGGSAGIRRREELAALLTFQFEAAAEPGATMFGGEAFQGALDRGRAAITRLLAQPDWHTALVVAHEGMNRLILGWCTGNDLRAVQAFEQDLACINILDFDMVPRADGSVGTEIQRAIIKAVNITPYDWMKHGMAMTSFEAIFAKMD